MKSRNRLKFLAVTIPPLRNRIEDIEPLVVHFCQKHNRETGDRKQFLAREVTPEFQPEAS
jgi:transcriptional regulator with PAS, ATPase and Fis domain